MANLGAAKIQKTDVGAGFGLRADDRTAHV